MATSKSTPVVAVVEVPGYCTARVVVDLASLRPSPDGESFLVDAVAVATDPSPQQVRLRELAACAPSEGSR